MIVPAPLAWGCRQQWRAKYAPNRCPDTLVVGRPIRGRTSLPRRRIHVLVAAVLAMSMPGAVASADDPPQCVGVDATIVGDVDGDGVITGTDGHDVIIGTAGADRIESYGGKDRICAFGGDDVIFSGAGNDVVYAGSGDDSVSTGGGRDILFGGDGDDTLRSGVDDDKVYGLDGNDVVRGLDGDDILRGGDGNDDIRGGYGDDTLQGDEGRDDLYGQAGADIIEGGAGTDRLWGKKGDDIMMGGDHADRIWAGGGVNLIDGGSGYDLCDGPGATSECEAVVHSWTAEEWRDLVAEYFDPLGETENALLIMACESDGNPFAKNTRSTASGLFQFLRGTWDWMAGRTDSPLFYEGRYEPTWNVINAAELVSYSIENELSNGPWAHWTCRYVLDDPPE